jgi:putative zinc finger protein
MDCAAVKPRMEALVSGSLPESERAEAEQHISICEGCRLELELVRAIGSQEKPQTAGKEDWTLDRIFGSQGGQSNAQQAAPSSDPAPNPAPSAFPASWTKPKPQPEDSREESGRGTSNADDSVRSGMGDQKKPVPHPALPPEVPQPENWDFEPADAKSSVKPPEESLFFAAEALTRSKKSEKKGSKAVLLWGVGGVIGAVLLAASGWFALRMTTTEIRPPVLQSPANPPSDGGTPVQGGPEQAPDPGSVEPPMEELSPDPVPEAPDNTVQERNPRMTTSSTSPSPLAVNPSAGRKPSTGPMKPSPSGAAPAPRTTTSPQLPLPQKPVTKGIQQPPASIPRPAPWIPPPDDEAPAPAPAPTVTPKPRYVAPPPEAADGSAEPAPVKREPAPAPPQEKPRPQSWLDAHAGSGPSTRSGATGSTSTSETPPAADPAPGEVVSPIERLHLATADAEEREDLDALRRLRTSWKNYMSKMGVGPLRSRAKREYADCIWAIQSMTGSRADQKSAVAAYREYLLGAPAGGADSRSVSRLRQLEDALSERH